MNNPSILAVILVAALPAAAQTDAGFAAALGKPLPGLVTMARLKTEPQVPAEPQGAAVPAAAWRTILEIMRTSAKFQAPAPGEELGTLVLIERVEDPKSEYTTMGIDMLVAKKDRGMEVAAARFAAVTITGNGAVKRAISWEFITDPQGRLQSASLSTMNLLADGKVSDQKSTVLDVADPKITTRFDAIIRFWAE